MADILSFLDNKAPELFAIADEVWAAAEVGFQEHKSSKVQADYLEANGFTLEPGVADVPTAFIAEWGSGRPFIGFLGEFDALAGISQEVSPERKPIVAGGPGHGCGHNLLGTQRQGRTSVKGSGQVRHGGP